MNQTLRISKALRRQIDHDLTIREKEIKRLTKVLNEAFTIWNDLAYNLPCKGLTFSETDAALCRAFSDRLRDKLYEGLGIK